jgi:hypothetical protein
MHRGPLEVRVTVCVRLEASPQSVEQVVALLTSKIFRHRDSEVSLCDANDQPRRASLVGSGSNGRNDITMYHRFMG